MSLKNTLLINKMLEILEGNIKSDDFIKSMHEMCYTLFLLSHSNQNNTYHFLRFFKENNYFDFMYLDDKDAEPTKNEIELIENCNFDEANDKQLIKHLESMCENELGKNYKSIDVANILFEDHCEFTKNIHQFLSDDTIIRIILTLTFGMYIANNDAFVHNFVVFLHSNHIRIISVADPSIPLPTKNEVNIFSRFNNNNSFPINYLNLQEAINNYTKCLMELHHSLDQTLMHLRQINKDRENNLNKNKEDNLNLPAVIYL
jgi:hypothetical protein